MFLNTRPLGSHTFYKSFFRNNYIFNSRLKVARKSFSSLVGGENAQTLNKKINYRNPDLYYKEYSIFKEIMIEKGENSLVSEELNPLPSAKVKLEKILTYLNSSQVENTCKKYFSLELLRQRLKTSILQLNFQPEIIEKNKPNYKFLDSSYPYEPVFYEPFPARPSFEVIYEAMQFAHVYSSLVEDAKSDQLIEDLSSYGPYRVFIQSLNSTPQAQTLPKVIEKKEIIEDPITAYFEFKERLEKYGETASFPEFADPVSKCLKELDLLKKQHMGKDLIFILEIDHAIEQLLQVERSFGPATEIHAAFNSPFPYRRVIASLEKAVEVFDMSERLKYSETTDWFEVEESWYPADEEQSPKLLPLYHYNRYKYQQFGLLANPEVIIFPWFGDAELEDLIRLRTVPIGLVGITSSTIRADRHHNTPLDFWYHDINHVRRMWGYDKKLITQNDLYNSNDLKNHMIKRQNFLADLLEKSDPNAFGLSEEERQIRILERYIIFETFHETALSATKESLLNDLTRNSSASQPFEVQIQRDDYLKELNRQFDGNLKSGTNFLNEDLSEPIKIQYFFDRAPGFLSNVYNKIAFGFHAAVFEDRLVMENLKYRTPEYLAKAAINVFKHVDYPIEKIPSISTLIEEINDRAGQPELYNYFALRPEDDLTQHVRSKIHKKDSFHLNHEIKTARALYQKNPALSPSEIASQVVIVDKDYQEIFRWMQENLEEYLDNFDAIFDEKLNRSLQHPFANADDYIQQFIGNEKNKLISTTPSEQEKQMLNKGGTLYVDTWAVPFFNTTTQTREEARNGIKKAVATFRNLNLNNMSLYTFTELASLYSRPEFNDVRRYKIKIFPSEFEMALFSNERNDAKTIGDHFPNESFIFTNKELSLDELSFTFGQNIHYLGLVSHSDTMKADTRVFVGPADFYEHDFAHGYFSLELPVPGTPQQWNKIHEEFRLIQAKIPGDKEKLMNSLVYFHFTHESGYKGILVDDKGGIPLEDAYKKELEVIISRIETLNDYDWIKKTEFIGEDYEQLLVKSFINIGKFFDSHLKSIQSFKIIEKDNSLKNRE